ncbi:hypothetical protein C8J57DRAFT_1515712 [Mycena rebaudengoi]|nr:hypothetical protein C8J57DRAFT_1515712 [Mycena rebaudengoi]
MFDRAWLATVTRIITCLFPPTDLPSSAAAGLIDTDCDIVRRGQEQGFDTQHGVRAPPSSSICTELPHGPKHRRLLRRPQHLPHTILPLVVRVGAASHRLPSLLRVLSSFPAHLFAFAFLPVCLMGPYPSHNPPHVIPRAFVLLRSLAPLTPPPSSVYIPSHTSFTSHPRPHPSLYPPSMHSRPLLLTHRLPILYHLPSLPFSRFPHQR